jgi:lipopolysaccharide export system permease protein
MLFDSSLRRDLARAFGATLAIILTIVLTMFLIRTLGQAAVGRISPQDIVLLMGFTALAHLPTMLSLSLFISVVVTLGRMYRDSEMTIWFASGAGLSRFVRPVLRTSAPALIVITLLLLFAWPWVNQQSAELKDRFERRSDLARVAPGQFQSSRDGSRVFFIERNNEADNTGRNVFILATQHGKESVTTARSGHIDNTADASYLVLDSGQRNEQNLSTQEKTVARFENYRIQIGERARIGTDALPPKARRTVDLLRNPNAPNNGELTWRVGLALGAANLLLLGLGLSATQPRRASNWNLLFALLSFVVYYNLINLSQAWVASGKLRMGATLGVIHGGAFVLAMGLLWWRDHGTHWRGLRRTAPPAPMPEAHT